MKRAIVETATILGITAISVSLIVVGETEQAINCVAVMLTFSIIVLAVEKFL